METLLRTLKAIAWVGGAWACSFLVLLYFALTTKNKPEPQAVVQEFTEDIIFFDCGSKFQCWDYEPGTGAKIHEPFGDACDVWFADDIVTKLRCKSRLREQEEFLAQHWDKITAD